MEISCKICGEAANTVPYSMAGEHHKYGPLDHDFQPNAFAQLVDAISTEELFGICPACGEYIDYCQGHGDIGDPYGREILDLHDNDIHDRCHENADCQQKEN